MFWNIVLGLLSFALQIILTPKPQNAKPKSLEDFELPTAEDGREIPVVFGTVDISGPNVTWYGDLKKSAIKGPREYGIFGPKQTIGYKYSLGVKMGLCHGPADAIYEIRVADKQAWRGASAGGRVTINKSSLFGGDKSEGGIKGAVDICMGAPGQLQNDYLVAKLGSDVPAFRGVVNVILRQVYLGTSNYIKPWSFRLQRILLTSTGAAQWYPEKAALGESSTLTLAVNQQVLSPLGTVQLNYAVDIKGGIVVNSGPGIIQAWRYPDFSTPIWTRTDLSPQSVSIDDAGNLIASYQNGTTVDVLDVTTGELKATISGMGFISNSVVTTRTDGGTTFIFLFEGNFLYLASGSDALWTVIDDATAGYTWLTSCQSVGVSGSNVYLANNGFLTHARNVRVVPWSALGFGVSTEVDISSDLFGDIVLIAWLDDLDSLLIIDSDSGLHLYNSDLSERVLFKHGTDEDKWSPGGASVLTGNRIEAGDDLIVFRATGHGDYSSNVIVQYRASDLTLVSITDASDAGYFNGANSGYVYSGVDPDNDFMVVLGNSGTAPLAAWSLPPSAALDMNPAHIIRECLTDATWGMGYNASDIDDDAFTYAADIFFDEGFGLSLQWTQEEEIQEFVSTILAHVDAYLYVSRSTGKFVLKPIRDDYDIDSIPVLDEDDVTEWTEVQHRSISEAISRVQVKFYDRINRQDAGHAVTNLAQAMQARTSGGGVLSATREYPGISQRSLAARVAARDVRSLGAGMISGRIVAKRTVESMNPGDPFRLVSSRHRLAGEVMRVGDLGFGDGRSNKIQVKFVQDVFHLSAAVLIDDSGTEWTPPSSDPAPVSPRLVWEMPYREARQMVGDTDLGTILTADPDAGLLQVAGSAPTADAYEATVQVNTGSGYSGTETMNFAPGAFLSGDLAIDATAATVSGAIDFDIAVNGTLAAIVGSSPQTTEIIRIDTVSDASLTISRGFLDTVPQAHSAGKGIVFFDDFSTSDFEQYTAAKVLGVKLLTATGAGVLPEASAPTNTVTFDSRLIRPERPADCQLNHDGYGPLDATALDPIPASWVNRNRLIELDGPPSWTDADETQEAGQTTTLHLTDEDGTIVHSYTGLSGTSYDIDPTDFGALAGGYVVFDAERDGYTAWQTYRIRVLLGSRLLLSGDEQSGIDHILFSGDEAPGTLVL